ncbi:MAG: cytochrome c family protein [Candidatus Heimdallarchaeota archaeon]|nr:cytochrome c family protein [Candidatus Heimdallarchaeota archaeon]
MKKIIISLLTLTAFVMAQDFEYVGNASCKMCHNKAEKGEQYTKWTNSVHAKAFETLKSEESAQIAKDKGIEVEAWKAPECLKCHVTGFGEGGYEVMGNDFWNPAEDDKAGAKAVKRMKGLQAVGCETCHGPGSKYKSKKVKQAIVAGEIEASSVGLLEVNEETCVACHNEESPTYKSFNYEERNAEIAHPVPETE